MRLNDSNSTRTRHKRQKPGHQKAKSLEPHEWAAIQKEMDESNMIRSTSLHAVTSEYSSMNTPSWSHERLPDFHRGVSHYTDVFETRDSGYSPLPSVELKMIFP